MIGWPAFEDAEGEFGLAFLKLAAFQLQMANEGFFVRGAISVGQAYIDEIAVFGSALTEAYIGESNLARDPRIILTSSAAKAIKNRLGYYGYGQHAPQVRCVLADADGQWFLNYLDCILQEDYQQPPLYKDLLRHKTAVDKQLKKHKSNPQV